MVAKAAAKHSGKGKPKLTKEERRAKYTQIARDRSSKQRARNAARTLVCFQCRKRGHAVSDCPERKEVSCCYKCGSVEHPLAKCPKRNDGDESLPFATCFVCKETGHLASQCPQNDKGVYVHGGACKHCGSKQHKVTDCPEREKTKQKTKVVEEESDFEGLLEGDGDQQPDSKKQPSPKRPDDKEKKGKKSRVVKF